MRNHLSAANRRVRIRSSRGFTLIELMIVVVILGIIVAVAIPSYLDQTSKVRRQDGRELLLNTAQLLERCYTTHGSYNDANCSVSLPMDSQDGFYQLPANGNNGVNIAANTFTLVVVPQGGHAGDDCGNLTLSSTGAKGRTGGANMDKCW